MLESHKWRWQNRAGSVREGAWEVGPEYHVWVFKTYHKLSNLQSKHKLSNWQSLFTYTTCFKVIMSLREEGRYHPLYTGQKSQKSTWQMCLGVHWFSEYQKAKHRLFLSLLPLFWCSQRNIPDSRTAALCADLAHTRNDGTWAQTLASFGLFGLLLADMSPWFRLVWLKFGKEEWTAQVPSSHEVWGPDDCVWYNLAILDFLPSNTDLGVDYPSFRVFGSALTNSRNDQ